MLHTEAQKTIFIQHLEYLLTLGDVQRSRRADWRALKRLLMAAGYWKRRYRTTDERKMKQKQWCAAQNNKRLKEMRKLREAKEEYDNISSQNY
jgi:hypothetical protein